MKDKRVDIIKDLYIYLYLYIKPRPQIQNIKRTQRQNRRPNRKIVQQTLTLYVKRNLHIYTQNKHMKRLFLAVRQKKIIITILSFTLPSELFKWERMKNPSVKENMEQLELSQTSDMCFKLTSTFKYCTNTIWSYFKVKKIQAIWRRNIIPKYKPNISLSICGPK